MFTYIYKVQIKISHDIYSNINVFLNSQNQTITKAFLQPLI